MTADAPEGPAGPFPAQQPEDPEDPPPREGPAGLPDSPVPSSSRGLGAWVLAAAFLAIVFRWMGPLDTLESAYLAVLLLLLPRLAGAQRGDDPDALALPRNAIYLQSGIMLGVLGGLAAWLGTRRGGWSDLFLDPIGAGPLTRWTGALTVLAVLLMLGVHAVRQALGDPEPPLVQRLLPETPGEKAGFAALSVMAGVGEELAYRGFGLAALTAVTGAPLFSAVVTSAAFGWVHAYQGVLGMVRAGLLGLMFCGPVLVAGTLWPAIVAHTLVDWIGGLMIGKRLLRDHGSPADPADA